MVASYIVSYAMKSSVIVEKVGKKGRKVPWMYATEEEATNSLLNYMP